MKYLVNGMEFDSIEEAQSYEDALAAKEQEKVNKVNNILQYQTTIAKCQQGDQTRYIAVIGVEDNDERRDFLRAVIEEICGRRYILSKKRGENKVSYRKVYTADFLPQKQCKEQKDEIKKFLEAEENNNFRGNGIWLGDSSIYLFSPTQFRYLLKDNIEEEPEDVNATCEEVLDSINQFCQTLASIF